VQNARHPESGARHARPYLFRLLFAHVFVRFLPWPHTTRPAWAARLVAAGVKILLAAVLLMPGLRLRMLALVAVFALIASAIDRLEEKSGSPPWVSFLAAQLAQLPLCLAIALWWSTAGDLGAAQQWTADVLRNQPILILAVGYIVGVFGGGELTRKVTDSPFADRASRRRAATSAGWSAPSSSRSSSATSRKPWGFSWRPRPWSGTRKSAPTARECSASISWWAP
jgi:hypothetical protein